MSYIKKKNNKHAMSKINHKRHLLSTPKIYLHTLPSGPKLQFLVVLNNTTLNKSLYITNNRVESS